TGSIDNLNAGLISAGGSLDLSAIGDIGNISSVISGKTVSLESATGNISNLTRTEQWAMNNGYNHFSGTDTGPLKWLYPLFIAHCSVRVRLLMFPVALSRDTVL
ncbi:hypothetical protein, partial [Escherichia coli]|uniref:hypothetical protein n=1 Tax=Escherichia coli TaxID=562 RepID=UPI00207B5AD7